MAVRRVRTPILEGRRLTPSRWVTFASWWERLLATAAASAVAFTLVAAVMFPQFATTADWGWKLAAVVGLSLASAASLEIAQRPVLAGYAQALQGLSRSQARAGGEVSAQWRDSLRPFAFGVGAARGRGEPVLPGSGHRGAEGGEVVGARALCRYGGVAVCRPQPATRSAVAGIRVVFRRYVGWMSYRARQLPGQVERLRAAAVEVPQAASALVETAVPVVLPPRRIWAAVLMVVVIGLGFGIAAFTWG